MIPLTVVKKGKKGPAEVKEEPPNLSEDDQKKLDAPLSRYSSETTIKLENDDV